MRKIINFLKLFFINLFFTRNIPLKVFFGRALMKKEYFKIKMEGEEMLIHWRGCIVAILARYKRYNLYYRGGRWYIEYNNLKISSKKLFKLSPLISEDLEKLYKVFDYRGKNVIDIGGYIGETALIFKKWGAKKVFIFEPLKENVEEARINIKLNGYSEEDIKIFPYAIGWDGKRIVKYCEESYEKTDFGLREGNASMMSEGWSWKRVIDFALKNKVDIIKVDCEGCERYLVDIPTKEIEKIPFWVIEAHSKEIKSKLMDKFRNFKVLKEFETYPNIFVIALSKF